MRDLVRMSDIIRIYNNYDCDKAREEVMKLSPIDMVGELEKIKSDIKDISKTLEFINHTTMVCDEDTKLFVSMEDIEKMFVKHIKKLKGEE